jgi:hypothetical protein
LCPFFPVSEICVELADHPHRGIDARSVRASLCFSPFTIRYRLSASLVLGPAESLILDRMRTDTHTIVIRPSCKETVNYPFGRRVIDIFHWMAYFIIFVQPQPMAINVNKSDMEVCRELDRVRTHRERGERICVCECVGVCVGVRVCVSVRGCELSPSLPPPGSLGL